MLHPSPTHMNMNSFIYPYDLISQFAKEVNLKMNFIMTIHMIREDKLAWLIRGLIPMDLR